MCLSCALARMPSAPIQHGLVGLLDVPSPLAIAHCGGVGEVPFPFLGGLVAREATKKSLSVR